MHALHDPQSIPKHLGCQSDILQCSNWVMKNIEISSALGLNSVTLNSTQ